MQSMTRALPGSISHARRHPNPVWTPRAMRSSDSRAPRRNRRRHDRFDNELKEALFDSTDYGSDLEMWMNRLNTCQASTRSVALLQLLRVDQEGAFANQVSGDVLDQTPIEATLGFKRAIDALNDRDRRQVTEIVSGVIRWQRRLHWVLTNLPKPTNVDAMDEPLRILLYMGAYEVRWLVCVTFS